MQLLPALLAGVAVLLSLTLSVRSGALALALGLVLLALLAHLTRASRTPWRSQGSDLITLLALAVITFLFALALP